MNFCPPKPGLHARRLDRLKRAVDMRPGLHMRGQHVGARIGVGLDVGIDRGDHQVHVHEGLHMRAERLDRRGAEGEVGHEMPVHHVDMDPIGALRLDGLDLLTEVGEIGREDGGGDLDGTVEGHGLRLLGRFARLIRRRGAEVQFLWFALVYSGGQSRSTQTSAWREAPAARLPGAGQRVPLPMTCRPAEGST